MQSLSRFLNDAQMAWLTSSINCCAGDDDVGSRGKQCIVDILPVCTWRGGENNSNEYQKEPEKSMRIVNGQPKLISPPTLQKPFERPDTATAFERPTLKPNDWVTTRSRSRASSRTSFSPKRSLSSRQTPGRLQISAPYNFQHHIETSYIREPPRLVVRPEPKLRPLELSIYLPGNRLSPLPEFGPEDSEHQLPHMRSESALSFRVPRKPLLSTVVERRSLSAEELLNALVDDLPNPTPRTRLRSNTEPAAYERVKSALLEKIELDQKLREIDDAIERRSIYLTSRPGSRASRADSRLEYGRPASRASRVSRLERRESIYSESTGMSALPSSLNAILTPTPEPMPLLPERVLPHADRRPSTAPSRPRRHKSTSTTSSTIRPPPLLKERPLPPPLPLVLQTPSLTPRRKSLSRVSSWLFPSTGIDTTHARHMSIESVTNTPKPVTSREGFYQCIEVKELESPQSPVSSVSSAVSGDATSWSSPSLGLRISVESRRGASSGGRTFGGKEKDEEAAWSMAFGNGNAGANGKECVGVAF
ncbi:acid phosphatase protein [Rutstroemia sp. NJR-2017a BVV2]|nr:acid phosphatase protein [Rutstroemia sp. NJR-2017a BVV2]